MPMLAELRSALHDWQRFDDVWTGCAFGRTFSFWISRFSGGAQDSCSSGCGLSRHCCKRELLWLRNKHTSSSTFLEDNLSVSHFFDSRSRASDGVRSSGGIHLGRTGSLAASFSVVAFSRERRLFLFSFRKLRPGATPTRKRMPIV